MPPSKNNPNCVTYDGGAELWFLLRRNAISLKKADVWTDLIHRCLASFKSAAFNLIRSFTVLFLSVTWLLKDLTALRTRAVTWSTFVRSWNRLMSIIWSIFLSGILAKAFTSEWTVTGGFLTTSWSAISSLNCVVRFSGHSDSGRYRKFGPFHHVSHATRALAVKPREGKSAGFRWPGQKTQCPMSLINFVIMQGEQFLHLLCFSLF